MSGNEKVSSDDIEMFGNHLRSCECVTCTRVRIFREELNGSGYKLVVD